MLRTARGDDSVSPRITVAPAGADDEDESDSRLPGTLESAVASVNTTPRTVPSGQLAPKKCWTVLKALT